MRPRGGFGDGPIVGSEAKKKTTERVRRGLKKRFFNLLDDSPLSN